MRGSPLKKLVVGALGVCAVASLTACAPATVGGQFSEPAYGWQRNGTYILTPAEMELDCDGLRVEQGKAAKAIAYVDTVRGQKFGQSLMISGVAALFGMVRLPDVGFEEQKAKEQLKQGAVAFNQRLLEKGCDPSDIDALIGKAAREFREERKELEAAAAADESSQNFNASSTDDEDEGEDNDVIEHELN